MKKYILLSALFCILFAFKTVGQPITNEHTDSVTIADSLFYEAARCYYAEHLKNYDVRDLQVSSKGFSSINRGDKKHRCYKVEVVYSIYESNQWVETHYKSWYWDLVEKKCYWYSDIRQKLKPGEPYRGMLTSVGYIDVTNDSFAQRGFKILKELQYE